MRAVRFMVQVQYDVQCEQIIWPSNDNEASNHVSITIFPCYSSCSSIYWFHFMFMLLAFIVGYTCTSISSAINCEIEMKLNSKVDPFAPFSKWHFTAMFYSFVAIIYYFFFHFYLVGSPRKKCKLNNGVACHQPKNTVAILNELRQGLIYKLEAQTGPIHAPVFTMTVEVCPNGISY